MLDPLELKLYSCEALMQVLELNSGPQEKQVFLTAELSLQF